MLKFRAKLGITAADLLPPSVALKLEGSPHQPSDENVEGGDVMPTNRRRCEVDIGRWKKEAEEMLDLLGTSAERAHGYPMTELKRKVGC